jgi:hypothetical protein
MVYFVLYIVLLSELLIVITERDELQEAENQIRDKMLSTLSELYKQPLMLSVPQKESNFKLGSVEPLRVVLTPSGLVSDSEKANVTVKIDIEEGSKFVPKNWPEGGIKTGMGNPDFRIERENGNAIFIANFVKEGDFKFVANCEVERQFPDYLPEKLKGALLEMVGDLKVAKSNSEPFIVKASETGVDRKEAEVSY